METPPKDKSKPEICTIRIVFPVESDEQALACKKKVSEALSDIPDVVTQFSISNMPLPAMGR